MKLQWQNELLPVLLHPDRVASHARSRHPVENACNEHETPQALCMAE